MILHAIAGMPRSGSTVLCNILGSRPDTTASATSCLPGFVRALGQVASNRIEMKNLLNLDLEMTQRRYARAVRSFCHAWHDIHGSEYVFDKSRGWTFMPNAFRDIAPRSVMILCVRDLRDVLASVEREEAKNGLISLASTSPHERYRDYFSAQGVIGGPYKALMALVVNMPQNVMVVRYEDLIAQPREVLAGIEERCEMPPFDYDLDNIPNLAGQVEPDGFWLGKFPHKAYGKLQDQGRPWQDTVPAEIAQDIVQNAQRFYQFFEYMTDLQPQQHQPQQVTPTKPATKTISTATDAEMEVCHYV